MRSEADHDGALRSETVVERPPGRVIVFESAPMAFAGLKRDVMFDLFVDDAT